jgi:hypothetical protein
LLLWFYPVHCDGNLIFFWWIQYPLRLRFPMKLTRRLNSLVACIILPWTTIRIPTGLPSIYLSKITRHIKL